MRRNDMFGRAVALSFLWAAVSLGADIYWVSPTGAASWAASESDTPLSGAQCCSLADSLSNAAAGDTVYLRGGTYNYHLMPQTSGAAGNPITFAAHSGETPVIENASGVTYATYYTNLNIFGKDHLKISGITFRWAAGVDRLFMMTHGATYNEIKDCVFDGGGSSATVQIWDGLTDGGIACEHNWIHGCTFRDSGEIVADGDEVDDKGGLQIGVPAYDNISGNNTIENCTFYGGGHHNLETFTKKNVIRNNHFYNAEMMENNTGNTAQYSADAGGKWGNRNFQIYDGYSEDKLNLVEGNRFGASGASPDDDGGDGLTVTSRHNIIRYNAIVSSQNNGVLFKIGAGSYAWNNRFYNNSIFGAGRHQNTPQWQGASLRWYDSTTDPKDNVVINNIMRGHGGSSEIGSAQLSPLNTLSNNWLTADGDPLFVSEDETDLTSPSKPSVRLRAGSGAIDNGAALTTVAVADTGSGSSLVVEDAQFFQDGTWGSSLSDIQPDWIAVGTVGNVVQIASIDYSTDTITLANGITRSDGQSVWLYKKSDGTRVLYGSAPDQGAFEYGRTLSISGAAKITISP